MFEAVISFVSQYIGIFLSKHNPEEMKKGEKYFRLIMLISLIALIVVLFFKFNLVYFIVGLVLGFILRKEYFYFGVASVSAVLFNLFLVHSFIFLYGLPYGTLVTYKKKIRELFYNVIWFFVPFVLYFFRFDLSSLALGGLISILFLQVKHVMVNWNRIK